MRATQFTRVVSLLVVATILGGCTANSMTPTPTSPAAKATHSVTTSSPSTSASATGPAVAAGDPSDPANWLISFNGIGPARIGESTQAALNELSAWGKPISSTCTNPAITFVGPSGATQASPDAILLSAASGTPGSGLVAVSLGLVGPVTEKGIRVGSTLAAVNAAYPQAVRNLRAGVTAEYVVKGDPGWITFQMADSSAGTTVDQVSVVAGSAPPDEFCG